MLCFCTSSVSCRHLFKSQGNIFIDIADYKIGSHINPPFVQSLISFNHDIDCGAITNSPAVRQALRRAAHHDGWLNPLLVRVVVAFSGRLH
jgi:hypothetical protein